MPTFITDLDTPNIGVDYDVTKHEMVRTPFNEVYTYAGEKLGYISRYPTYNPERDNEQYFAERQTNKDKVFNAAKQLFTLGKQSFVQQAVTLPNVIAGNNISEIEATKNLARSFKAMQDLYPIYETREQLAIKNQSADTWWGNAALSLKQFSPTSGRALNAWSNLIGQIGFTAGTMAYVGAESLAIGALTRGWGAAAKAPKNAQKILKTIVDTYKIKVAKSRIDTAKQSKNIFDYTVRGTQAVRSAWAEGAMEGFMNAEEYKQSELDKLRENGIIPTTEDRVKIYTDAKKISNIVTAANIPVLLITNELLFGRLYHGGTKMRGVNPITDMIKPTVKGGTPIFKTIQETVKDASKLGKFGYYSKGLITFQAKSGFSEGMEEILQGAAGHAAKRYLSQVESDAYPGVLAFAGMMAEDLKDSLETREGWDEFWSGFLTGNVMKTGGVALDRATGETAKKQKQAQDAVKEINTAIAKLPQSIQGKVAEALNPNTSSAAKNFLVQYLTGYESVEAANKGDIKTSNHLDAEAKAQFFYTLQKYDMLETTVKTLGETMEQFAEENPVEFKEMMGDKTVKEVTNALLADGKFYEKVFNRNDKKYSNPYDYKKDKVKYIAYEAAKKAYTDLEFYGNDILKRASSIRSNIENKTGLSRVVFEALTDPSNIKQTLAQKKKEFNDKKQSDVFQDDIPALEKEVEALQKISDQTFNEDGTIKTDREAEQVVRTVMDAVFGEGAEMDSDVKKDLIDLIKLEDEGAYLRHLINALGNEEYFEKYHLGFVDAFKNAKSIKALEEASKTPEQKTEEKVKGFETKSVKEIENELDEAGYGYDPIVGDAEIILNELEQNNNGDYVLDGQVYKTIDEAVEAAFSKLDEDSKKDLQDKPIMKEGIKNILKQKVKPKLTPQEVLQGEKPTIQQEADAAYTNNEAKKEAENGGKPFIRNTVSAILTHYYDKAVSFFYGNSDNIIQRWLEGDKKGQTEYQKKKQKEYDAIISEFKNKNPHIVSISLTDVETVLGGRTIEQFHTDESMIRVINDELTGRIFLLIDVGTAEEVKTTMMSALGLDINTVKVTNTGKKDRNVGFQLVKKEDGQYLLSPYKEAFTKAENKKSLNNLKKGEQLEVRIANTTFNEELQQKLNTKEITEEEYYDNLELELYANDGNIVGVIRRSNFLFDTDSQKEETEVFRQSLASRASGKKLGSSIGYVVFNNHYTSRGYNIQEGAAQATSYVEYKQKAEAEGHKVEIFVAKDTKTLVDEKGKEHSLSDFERATIIKGRAYMRITTNDGYTHITTLSTEKGRFIQPNEIAEQKTQQELTTYLDHKHPVISKRAIIDITKGLEEKRGEQEQEKEINKETTLQDQIDTNNGTIVITQQNGTEITVYNAKLEEGVITGDLEEIEEVDTDVQYVSFVDFVGEKGERRVRIAKVIDTEENIGGTIYSMTIEFEDGTQKTITNRTGVKSQLPSPMLTLIENPNKKERKTISIKVEDIKKPDVVEEIIEEQEEQEQPMVEEIPPFPDSGVESEIKDWIETYGEEGVSYPTSSTTTIKVVSKSENGVVVEEKIDDLATQYISKDGKRKYTGDGEKITNADIKTPSKDLLLKVYDKSARGQMLSYRERQLLLAHASRLPLLVKEREETLAKVAAAKEKPKHIDGFLHFTSTMGLDGNIILAKMWDTYKKALLEGNPYTYIYSLLEDVNLTDTERATMEAYLNHPNSVLLWAYITQVDAIKGENNNKSFQTFLTELDNLQELEEINNSVQNSNTADDSAIEYIIDKIYDGFSKFGVAITNLPQLKNIPYSEFKKVLGAYTSMMKSTSQALLTNTIEFLSEAANNGLHIIIDPSKTFYFRRVGKKSLGREIMFNPQAIILVEAGMMSDGVVKNEEDGLFVRIKDRVSVSDLATSEKNIDNIEAEVRKIKELFLSLGVDVAEQGILRYGMINNSDFSMLKERLIAEKLRNDNIDSEVVSLSEEEVVRDGQIVESKIVAPILEINGKYYKNVLSTKNMEYYTPIGREMTPFALNNLMNKKGVKAEKYIKATNAIASVKKPTLNNKNKLTCA